MRAFEFLTEDPVVKQRVLRGLAKKPDEHPIFDKVYKTLVGDPLSGRIKKYISARGDADASDAMDHLDRLIPTLGTADEVKSFIEKFKEKGADSKPKDFIKLSVAFPKKGMDSAAPLSSVVEDGFAKKLFDSLTTYKGKNDAGPGEAALAIMSPNITYAQGATVDEYGRGGDIIVNGIGKVEVKGGAGGRLIPLVTIDQKGMTAALGEFKLTKPESVKARTAKQAAIRKAEKAGLPPPEFPKEEQKFLAGVTTEMMSKPLSEGFPKEQFMRAVCQAWFGEERQDLIKAAGTPSFRRLWLNAMYDGYQQYAGFNGILFLSSNAYQYTVSGSQIPDSYVKSWGYLYYPNSKQIRDMAPQVVPQLQ